MELHAKRYSDYINNLLKKVGGPNPDICYVAFRYAIYDKLHNLSLYSKYPVLCDKIHNFCNELIKLGILQPEILTSVNKLDISGASPLPSQSNSITQLKLIEFFIEPLKLIDKNISNEEYTTSDTYFTDTELDEKLKDLLMDIYLADLHKVDDNWKTPIIYRYIYAIFDNLTTLELEIKFEAFTKMLNKARSRYADNFNLELFVEAFTVAWLEFFTIYGVSPFTQIFSFELEKRLSKKLKDPAPIYHQLSDVKLYYIPLDERLKLDSRSIHIRLTSHDKSKAYTFSALRHKINYSLERDNDSLFYNIQNVVALHRLELQDGTQLFQIVVKLKRKDLYQSVIVDTNADAYDKTTRDSLDALGIVLDEINIEHSSYKIYEIEKTGTTYKDEPFILLDTLNYIPYCPNQN